MTYSPFARSHIDSHELREPMLGMTILVRLYSLASSLLESQRKELSLYLQNFCLEGFIG